MRILLCGTNYGSSYLRALYQNESGLRVAGILARSERSRAMAAQYAVPFYTGLADLPPDTIDAACLAIPGANGLAVTSALLERGIHVLAEHPLYAHEIAAHRRTARTHGAVYHVNAHYSDLEAAATFVSAFRAARLRAPLLFISVMTNSRALYSAIEIVARAAGSLRPFTLEEMPWRDGSFFRLVHVDLPDAPLTFQVQKMISQADDGSSCWVSHNITAGFGDGVLSLAEAPGPLGWLPTPPSVPQLLSQQGAQLWARPMWRTLATPPATFGDYAGWARDRANCIALARFAAEIAGGPRPAEQSDEHLLGVSELWEAMIPHG